MPRAGTIRRPVDSVKPVPPVEISDNQTPVTGLPKTSAILLIDGSTWAAADIASIKLLSSEHSHLVQVFVRPLNHWETYTKHYTRLLAEESANILRAELFPSVIEGVSHTAPVTNERLGLPPAQPQHDRTRDQDSDDLSSLMRGMEDDEPVYDMAAAENKRNTPEPGQDMNRLILSPDEKGRYSSDMTIMSNTPRRNDDGTLANPLPKPKSNIPALLDMTSPEYMAWWKSEEQMYKGQIASQDGDSTVPVFDKSGKKIGEKLTHTTPAYVQGKDVAKDLEDDARAREDREDEQIL